MSDLFPVCIYIYNGKCMSLYEKLSARSSPYAISSSKSEAHYTGSYSNHML